MISNVLFLHHQISNVAPIESVDNTGLILFKPEATEQERTEAQAIVANWVDPPVEDWEGVVADLMMASVYDRAKNATKTSEDIRVDYEDCRAYLLACLSSERMRNAAALESRLRALKATMGDWSGGEVTSMNNILSGNGFTFNVTG